MRLRPALAALAAVATAFTAPAHAAATAGVVVMNLHLGCYGCGATSVTGTLSCVGACVIDGVTYPLGGTFPVSATADAPASTCPVTGIVFGQVGFPGDAAQLNLTWSGLGYAGNLMFRNGSVALTTGAFLVTSPLGIACGLPADVTTAGVAAGV
jgi:hypothetical protein